MIPARGPQTTVHFVIKHKVYAHKVCKCTAVISTERPYALNPSLSALGISSEECHAIRGVLPPRAKSQSIAYSKAHGNSILGTATCASVNGTPD